jgi:site-specific DNA-methyltransferase (adenine-specific)
MTDINTILCGDALAVLRTLPDGCISMIVTSPPYYGLRDYGVNGQIGLESSPAEYVSRLVAVFNEARRVLRPDGTLWLNIADSYAGSGKGVCTDTERVGKQRYLFTPDNPAANIPTTWAGIKPKLFKKTTNGSSRIRPTASGLSNRAPEN